MPNWGYWVKDFLEIRCLFMFSAKQKYCILRRFYYFSHKAFLFELKMNTYIFILNSYLNIWKAIIIS